MHFGFRRTVMAIAAAAACLSASAARAGDDGAAPLWVGIGSIFAPVVGLGKDEKPSIEYREHGKIVVPKSMDLPQPGASAVTTGGAWPVNQEAERKRLAKEEEKREAAKNSNVPARIRATQGFPNAPVTIRASDQIDGALPGESGGAKTGSSTVLENLNPLGWVGLGKKANTALGPEPDREWLTDPPKGYREPVAATSGGTTGQVSK